MNIPLAMHEFCSPILEKEIEEPKMTSGIKNSLTELGMFFSGHIISFSFYFFYFDAKNLHSILLVHTNIKIEFLMRTNNISSISLMLA
jgi:hypothetical protein